MHKRLIILLLMSTMFSIASAQSLELGGFAGVDYYNGDLNPAVPYNKIKPVYGFMARYSKGTRWAFRTNFTTGVLASDGKYARVDVVNDQSFEKVLSDLSIVAEFNFFDYFTGSQKDYVTPYIFGGISMFGHDTSSFVQSLTFTNLSLPFGVGVKYSLTKKLGITVEWKMHKAFADDIDNTITLKSLASGNPDIGLSGIAYDDPNTNDWYSFTGITLTYKFNLEKKHKCNTFENYLYE